MSKLLHVLREILYTLGSLASRTLNALAFRGSMHQTLSSRAHMMAADSPKWAKRQRLINRLIFWEPDHCARAWAAEVDRARRTLERAGVIKWP